MSFDQRVFRDALGQFPTGVTVITANPDGCKPFGVTANSFSSVSLDPPLILWSLQKNSDTFSTFEKTTHFAVNVLTDKQEAISNQYAKKNNHDLNDEHFQLGETGTPLLYDALVSFECEVDMCHDAGDHIIIVAKVLAMTEVNGAKPLVFCSGKYRELAPLEG